MRQIPEELVARVESGAAGICHAWVLTRADGVRLGFTDHDRDLEIEGVVCRAASGWTAGAAESAVGLRAGSAAVGGGLDDASIAEADVEAGLFDQARIALWRVDWARPELRVRLWTARLAKIRREGAAHASYLLGDPFCAAVRLVGAGRRERGFEVAQQGALRKGGSVHA